MFKININLGRRSYPIYISSDYLNINNCLNAAKLKGKIIVITDENVEKYQYQNFKDCQENFNQEINKYVIKPGEFSKNLSTVEDLYKFLVSKRADRDTTLIALGGGIVGDITGFVAATYLRGINFVQVPTTLLAQVDSSVGGKVGVDFEGIKNIIGAFYQPKFVYINVSSLKTLPKREISAGLAEVIKHAVIRDKDFFDYIEYNMIKIFNFDENVLQYLIKTNCQIKGSIIEADEKENGIRAILNYGHTIGHAIESISNFNYLHGECVSLGMVAAMKLSKYFKMIKDTDILKVISILRAANLPISFENIDIEAVFGQLFFDKKIKNNRFTFVLSKGIGEVELIKIDDPLIIKTVL